MTDYNKMIEAEEVRIRNAQAKIEELKKRKAHDDSFNPTPAEIVMRRCIDTGRLVKIEGVFFDNKESVRFANGLDGYGLGKDIFIEPVTAFNIPTKVVHTDIPWESMGG